MTKDSAGCCCDETTGLVEIGGGVGAQGGWTIWDFVCKEKLGEVSSRQEEVGRAVLNEDQNLRGKGG